MSEVFRARYVCLDEDGDLCFDFEDGPLADGICKSLGRDNLEIEIRAAGQKRSEESHGLFATWNRIFARECGYTEEQMKDEFFKMMGYGEEVWVRYPFSPKDSLLMFRRRSQKSLSKDEMTALLNFMDQTWSENFGGVLPKRVLK